MPSLRTALCRLLGIEHPVLSVGFGAGARAEFVAAVSNAGSAFKPFAGIEREKLTITEGMDDMGSLTEAPTIRPTEHIFVGPKAAWFEITDNLPQFDEYAI